MSKPTDEIHDKHTGCEVSVIIPFLNNPDEVVDIVRTIREQNRGRNLEMICIDNGSEKPVNFSREFLLDNLVLSEKTNLNSPYSARNRGVERASGAVIVFVDANSVPAAGWLANGLRCMKETGADIVAGHVGFEFNDAPDAAKVVDAISSIDQKKSVEERKAAFTANLFVRREIFTQAGLFEEGARSGGDVRWTKNASAAGFSIIYCPDSVVLKKARSYRALFKKRVRTGRGYLYTWLKDDDKSVWFYNFFRSLKPPPPRKPAQLYRERYKAPLPTGKAATWMVYYMMGIVEQFSFMAEYLRYTLGSGRSEERHREIQGNG